MKILNQSVSLAKQLFAGAYANKRGYQSFHFCFAYERNKLIAIGQNITHCHNIKAIKFANKFGCVEQYRKYFLHAEIDCISKMYGRYHINSRTKFVVLRLNSAGELCNSKPCPNCKIVLDAFNVDRIWYSNEQGEIVNG